MSQTKLARAVGVRAYDHRDGTTVLGRDGVARTFGGESADLARALLECLATPRDRDAVLAHLAQLAGAPIEHVAVVDQALDALRAAGAVQPVTTTTTPHAHARAVVVVGAPPAGPRRRLVLGISGAINAVHTPALVGMLLGAFDVRVALTQTAAKLVSVEGLEALTHQPVACGVWARATPGAVPHIQLAEWADAVLICPATATTVGRIAGGNCSDLVSALAIATHAPVLVVPSMNGAMYTAPSVQRNLALLRDDGFYLAQPSYGHEVAHAPDARTPMYGVAPSHQDVCDILQTILATRGGRPAGRAAPPRTDAPGPAWDQVYAATALAELPWYVEGAEPDLLAAFERVAPPPARFLDVGTGPGTVAIEAARRGYAVVATDVAPRAIDAAVARAGALPITWLVDDVLATGLRGAFDVVHDRGCFHVLPEARRGEYVAAVAGLTASGARLVLKTHAPAEGPAHGTHPLDPAAARALFGHAFELEHAEETTLAGPGHRNPRAFTFVLRRR